MARTSKNRGASEKNNDSNGKAPNDGVDDAGSQDAAPPDSSDFEADASRTAKRKKKSHIHFLLTLNNHREVPKNVTHVDVAKGVTEIPNSTFSGCTSLKWVKIPKGVRKIGNCAFLGCSSLEGIALSSTLTEIDDAAFYRCNSLKWVNIPEGVLRIGNRAFQNCSLLESITLPFTLSKICYGAFSNCNNLKAMNLPEGLQSIGWNAFLRCSSLAIIKFHLILKRIKAIPPPLQTEIEIKINDTPGVAMRGGDICIVPTVIPRGEGVVYDWDALYDDWDTHKEKLSCISRWIDYYELREASSIIELALWKAKIEERDDSSGDNNREDCREKCGKDTDVIVKAVLPFISYTGGL